MHQIPALSPNPWLQGQQRILRIQTVLRAALLIRAWEPFPECLQVTYPWFVRRPDQSTNKSLTARLSRQEMRPLDPNDPNAVHRVPQIKPLPGFLNAVYRLPSPVPRRWKSLGVSILDTHTLVVRYSDVLFFLASQAARLLSFLAG